MDCTLTSELKVADLLRVVTVKEEPYKGSIHKFVGLAVGFPVAMYVPLETTLGMYVHVAMPPWHIFDVEGGMKRCAGFEFKLKLGWEVRATESLFDGVQPCGWRDMFRKPWETIVCPSSPYFDNGVLTIRLTMTPVKKEEGDVEGDEEGDY